MQEAGDKAHDPASAAAWLTREFGLPVTGDRLRRWWRDGLQANGHKVRLEAVKVGGRLVVRESALRGFIRAVQATEATAPHG
jgi:hypothetical protein